jgi:hypothetical protein
VNDLGRLLDDAVPEPRRALASDDLVRRARRRRTTRTAALGAVTAAAVVAGVAVAGAVTGGDATLRPPVAAGSPSIAGSPGTAGDWPRPADSDPQCPNRYPAELETFPNAFDATVTAVRPGARPEIDLAVHHVYAGPREETVTLTATPRDLPAEQESIVGMRVLVATRGHELTTCGFSRPWSGQDATAWYFAFEERDDCGLWDTRLYFPGFHERDFTGKTVEEASELARSRDLSVRLVGDGVQVVTDDLRPNRINLCNRDGIVTAAVRG